MDILSILTGAGGALNPGTYEAALPSGTTIMSKDLQTHQLEQILRTLKQLKAKYIMHHPDRAVAPA